LFVPCGGLSWLPVSFLLHVKYTLSYRIVSYRTFDAPVRRVPVGIAMTFGAEKLKWFDYPTVKNILKMCLFVSTKSTIVTDRQTDGQADIWTPHDGIARIYKLR